MNMPKTGNRKQMMVDKAIRTFPISTTMTSNMVYDALFDVYGSGHTFQKSDVYFFIKRSKHILVNEPTGSGRSLTYTRIK